jgi:hypothetical protein
MSEPLVCPACNNVVFKPMPECSEEGCAKCHNQILLLVCNNCSWKLDVDTSITGRVSIPEGI